MDKATLEKHVEGTLQQIGLKGIVYDTDTNKYLQLTQEELKGMSAEECGAKAYALKQYSFYLQMEYNKAAGIMKWAIRNINAVLAKEYHNFGDKYTKYEVRRQLLIQNNAYAAEMYKQFQDAKVRCTTLRGLSRSVSFIASALSDLQQTKRYQK